jgi:hypothetical protein
MPYLLTFAGISLLRRYVKNWYSVIATYTRLLHYTNANFRNGVRLKVSRSDYSDFREELFRQYLHDNGFLYTQRGGRPVVRTSTGIELILLNDYSNILDEIFLSKIYRKERLDNRIVIDVGASLGDSSLYFASLGASKVFGIEIDENRYNLALENIALNKMNEVISLSNEAASTASVTRLIDEHRLSHVFLKMDCEGCEYEIVNNLPGRIFESIDDIVMEYHHNPRPIEMKLKQVGFNVKRKKRFRIPEGRIYASRN